jgi:hypothetical protein
MEAQEHREEHNHGQEITVNGRSVPLTEGEPTGRQILAEAGFEQMDGHGLIQRVKIGSRLII